MFHYDKQTSLFRVQAQGAHWYLHPGQYLAAQWNLELNITEPSVHPLTHIVLLLAQGLYDEGADYCGHQGEKSWQVWRSPL